MNKEQTVKIRANEFLSNKIREYLDKVIRLGASFTFTESRRWYEFSTEFTITGEHDEVEMMKSDFKEHVNFT